MVQTTLGSLVFTSLVLIPAVYNLVKEYEKVPRFCSWAIMIQKILYAIIVLTQIFEWFMCSYYLKFQSKHKMEELLPLQNAYNKIEKRFVCLFVFILFCFSANELVISWFKKKFLEKQKVVADMSYVEWTELTSPEDQMKIQNSCMSNLKIMKYMYYSQYAVLQLLIFIVGFDLARTIKLRYNSEYQYHIKMIAKYTVWLTLSIIIKIW